MFAADRTDVRSTAGALSACASIVPSVVCSCMMEDLRYASVADRSDMELLSSSAVVFIAILNAVTAACAEAASLVIVSISTPTIFNCSLYGFSCSTAASSASCAASTACCGSSVSDASSVASCASSVASCTSSGSISSCFAASSAAFCACSGSMFSCFAASSIAFCTASGSTPGCCGFCISGRSFSASTTCWAASLAATSCAICSSAGPTISRCAASSCCALRICSLPLST